MDWLDEIEARAGAETSGKWGCRIDIGNRFYVHTPSYGVRDFCCLSGGFDRKEDADFIAHSREDVPKLVAEVRRLREEVCAAKDDMETLIYGRSACDLCDHDRCQCRGEGDVPDCNHWSNFRWRAALGKE